MLGIDPGTLRTGWGVIEKTRRGLTFCAGDVVSVKGFHSLPERLRLIYEEIVAVIDRWTPHVLSLEKAFVAHNVQSAFRLGEARGIVLLAAARAGLQIAEYNPTEIKMAVAGYGRAGKMQVQKAVLFSTVPSRWRGRCLSVKPGRDGCARRSHLLLVVLLACRGDPPGWRSAAAYWREAGAFLA